MSRASVQSLTILAVAHGAIVTMENEDIAGDVLPAVVYAREVGQKAINSWPETGDPRKNTQACFKHCKNLRDDLEKSANLYTGMCLISLSQLLLTDLAERVRNPKTLASLEPMMEAIDGIHDLLDPAGDRYEVYDEAERLAGLVKKEISF